MSKYDSLVKYICILDGDSFGSWGDCLSKCVTGLNWPVVWPVGKAGGRCLLGQWGNMTPTKKPDAEKRNAEREAALTFVRMAKEKDWT